MEGKKGVQGPPVKGRGRGRGIVAPRVAVAPGLQEPKEKSVKDLVKELQPSNLKSTVEFLTVRPMTSERHQDLLDKAVEEVCERMLENIEFVDIGAELLKYLWDAKLPDSVSIRKPLLTRIQTIYRARNNLTETEFQNYAALLCELFGCLTIGDQPLAALTGPVYALLHELLVDRGKSQNNILTFHMLILKHGLLLEKQEKVKMTELLEKVRDMAIADEKSKVHLCVFLEIIELHACGWKLPDDVQRYYEDALGEVMSTI